MSGSDLLDSRQRHSCQRLVALLALLVVPAAADAWSATGAGTGAAGAAAMPTGATPTAATVVTEVTVTWSASSVGAGALAGYRVKRYDSLSGVASTIGGNCTGVVAATSCIDSSAPLGTTPMHHAWTGTEGGRSTSVITL